MTADAVPFLVGLSMINENLRSQAESERYDLSDRLRAVENETKGNYV